MTEPFDIPETEAQPQLIVLLCEGAEPSVAQKASSLSARLGAPLISSSESVDPDATVLRFDADGVSLVGDGMTMQGDFVRMLPRLKPGRLSQELLVRAAKIKGSASPLVVDATAGMGEDSLLLAASGFRVRLFEKDPVIATLLWDTLRRSAEIPELADAVSRMDFVEGDSVSALRDLDERPDVVLLDPMFPARTKSASVKKKFQLLHRLEKPCDNEIELLSAAIAASPKKIVVKRPPKGPLLAGVKPSYSLSGKAVRYDCLVDPKPLV